MLTQVMQSSKRKVIHNNLPSGRYGEDLAKKFLRFHGYKILTTNFRSKFGEVDIIGLDRKTLVFIEVKTRWSKKFGEPEEAVTPWKLKSIIKTGEYYKMLHPELPESLRIDVVAISLSPSGPACRRGREVKEIKLIKNVTG